MATNQIIEMRQGAETVIAIRVDGIDLASKTATGAYTDISGTTTSVTGTLTVTQTGDPSIFTWTPSTADNTIARGLYRIQWTFTDGSGNEDKTNPNDKLVVN